MTVLLVLVLLMGACTGESNRNYIHVKEVTMTLKGGDAVFNVDFDLNSLAKLYVMALGSKYLENNLNHLFAGFGNIATVKSNMNQAVLVARDAAEYDSGYYLFESRPLGHKVPRLTVIYPEGHTYSLDNVSDTPSVFCEG